MCPRWAHNGRRMAIQTRRQGGHKRDRRMSSPTDVRAGGRGAHEPRSRGAGSVTKPVVLFAITGIAAVAALGFLSVHILQGVGQREAIRNAKRETQLAG